MKLTDKDIAVIAKATHEANRTYCQSIGDDSQPEWDHAPEWQRQSAINGVRFVVTNPNVTPAECHENWREMKVKEGWKWGEEKSLEKREHPCIVPYEALPPEQQEKDNVFRQTVLKHLNELSGQ